MMILKRMFELYELRNKILYTDSLDDRDKDSTTKKREGVVRKKSYEDFVNKYILACEEYITSKPSISNLSDIFSNHSEWKRKLQDTAFIMILLKKLRSKIKQSKKIEKTQFWTNTYWEAENLVEKALKNHSTKELPLSKDPNGELKDS